MVSARVLAKNVELTVGQVLSYDIHLPLGPFSETVEVTARPPLIDTGLTQQANTIDSMQVRNLPNISRNSHRPSTPYRVWSTPKPLPFRIQI
jgi:hypothetical protein